MEQEIQQQAGGVFLNGKAQIIEMLQFMSRPERDKLLKNIKLRNPALASELMEQSFSFSHIENLEGQDLLKLTGHIQAQIFGVALKNQTTSFQKKVLSAVNRNYAQEAYEVMLQPIKNENELVKRAQNKIINVLMNLSKKSIIDLSN